MVKIKTSTKIICILGSLAAVFLKFYFSVLAEIGAFNLDVMYLFFTEHLDVFSLFVSEAIGGSIAVPVIIAGIIVIYPFKRRLAVFLDTYSILLFATFILILGTAYRDGLL